MLEGLATRSPAQMNLNLKKWRTQSTINSLVSWNKSTKGTAKENESSFFHNDEYINDTAEEKELPTQLLKMQKNHLILMQELFERYCNTMPIFAFNSAKYDIDVIKSYLLPILVKERQIELTFIKKLFSLFPLSLVMCSYLIL